MTTMQGQQKSLLMNCDEDLLVLIFLTVGVVREFVETVVEIRADLIVDTLPALAVSCSLLMEVATGSGMISLARELSTRPSTKRRKQ